MEISELVVHKLFEREAKQSKGQAESDVSELRPPNAQG